MIPSGTRSINITKFFIHWEDNYIMVTKLLPFERKKRILIENLKKEGILKSKKVEEAIMRVPRELFVPEEYIEYAYFD
ncbi:MAG: hypothetical protein ACP5TH_07575, partial [Fervidicoccaceae archaeon]